MAKRVINRALMRLILRGALCLGVVVLIALSVSAWRVFVTERHVAKELATVAAEHAELLARKNALSRDLASLKTSRGIEAVIRERYPLAKPGEEVITLIAPSVSTSTNPVELGILGTIRNWFKL